MKTTDITIAAVLAALALAIPLYFRGTLQIVIPAIGYSATIASHVPVMISIMFGPLVAAIVGTASTLGFLATLGPVVGARASTHIVWAVAAAFAVKRGMSFPKALFFVALPIHAILEGLIVIPFGVPWQGALLNVLGTAIHHIIDSVISIAVVKAALPFIKRVKQTRNERNDTKKTTPMIPGRQTDQRDNSNFFCKLFNFLLCHRGHALRLHDYISTKQNFKSYHSLSQGPERDSIGLLPKMRNMDRYS